MAEKRRYTVSLPDHVADEVEAHAKPLGSTPTEYAGDIVRWWFGQGCPAVTHDEAALRRIKPLPENLDVWALDTKVLYSITDDAVVRKILNQIELPNLFAHAVEHDVARFSVAFDNHPTHWLMFNLFKGSDRKDGNGLLFSAYPKASTTREEMNARLQVEAKAMKSAKTFTFSQIPMLEGKKSGNQTTTKTTGVK